MEQPLKIRIDSPIAPEIRWAWDLFARDMEILWEEAEGAEPDLVIAEEAASDIRLSKPFREAFLAGRYNALELMPYEPLIRHEGGEADHLSTAFYLANSFQEYGNPARDRYGRFPFESSLQARFNCVERGLVGQGFRNLYTSVPKLARLGEPPYPPSSLFLSHDVDLVFQAWKEDGKHHLRHGRVDRFAGLAWRALKGKPDWLNARELMAMDQKWDMPATFFWIPAYSSRQQEPPDADYKIEDPLIREEIDRIDGAPHFEIGLHRSSRGKIGEECKLLPVAVKSNRNHLLLFRLPDHYEEVAASGLAMDCSLAFPEALGFRNSYGRPFRPWSLSRRASFPFLEVPMHAMDASFEHYSGGGHEEALKRISDFLHMHRRGCLISLLWHNNYVSPDFYAGYRKCYAKLLQHCKDLDIRGLTQDEILAGFGGSLKGTHRSEPI